MMRSQFLLPAMLAAAFSANGCISISTRADSPAADDACRAAAHRGFVGASIAATTFPEDVRVIAPNSIVTEDFVPTRLNVLVDKAGTITGFRCG